MNSISDLEAKFAGRTRHNPDFDRSLVSFQANKTEPFFRWFKYREGFSRDLVDYLIDDSGVPKGAVLLDPFAGSGSTMLAGHQHGLRTIGIELLPLGALVAELRFILLALPVAEVMSLIDTMQSQPWQRG